MCRAWQHADLVRLFVFAGKLTQELRADFAGIISRAPPALKTRSNFWFTSFQHKIRNQQSALCGATNGRLQ
jgi:hypothetical protein